MGTVAYEHWSFSVGRGPCPQYWARPLGASDRHRRSLQTSRVRVRVAICPVRPKPVHSSAILELPAVVAVVAGGASHSQVVATASDEESWARVLALL